MQFQYPPIVQEAKQWWPVEQQRHGPLRSPVAGIKSPTQDLSRIILSSILDEIRVLRQILVTNHKEVITQLQMKKEESEDSLGTVFDPPLQKQFTDSSTSPVIFDKKCVVCGGSEHNIHPK